jgi:hypothetical protein
MQWKAGMKTRHRSFSSWFRVVCKSSNLNLIEHRLQKIRGQLLLDEQILDTRERAEIHYGVDTSPASRPVLETNARFEAQRDAVDKPACTFHRCCAIRSASGRKVRMTFSLARRFVLFRVRPTSALGTWTSIVCPA